MLYIESQDIMYLGKEDFVESEEKFPFKKSNLKSNDLKQKWNTASLVLLKIGNINYTVLKTRY